MEEKLREILTRMREKKASDLHLGGGMPMYYRIDDELEKISSEVISEERARQYIYSLLDEEMTARFENRKELDFSFQLEDVARFRANVFIQRGKIACAIRIIPFNIWSIEECGLPEDVVRGFCQLKKGLVLVTGATGSGKSTTLASMVDEINSSRKSHIVTVEDPIEFVHDNKLSIVDQRQVTEDTPSFNSALTHVLRQDPDVILIGEMRDLETIQSALVIADTGHLVLATLHTSDSIQTINRIIDVFPSHQQKQIRAQLSFVLSGILSQQLIPCADREGRVLAAEILVATPAIRSMIRDAKEAQIYSVLQTSQKAGMRTMNQALSELCALGAITKEEALARTSDPHELMNIIK